MLFRSRGREAQQATGFIEHHKVVAGALHLGEPEFHAVIIVAEAAPTAAAVTRRAWARKWLTSPSIDQALGSAVDAVPRTGLHLGGPAVVAGGGPVQRERPRVREGTRSVGSDRDGVTVLDDWDGFGQRATGTGTACARTTLGA